MMISSVVVRQKWHHAASVHRDLNRCPASAMISSEWRLPSHWFDVDARKQFCGMVGVKSGCPLVGWIFQRLRTPTKRMMFFVTEFLERSRHA